MHRDAEEHLLWGLEQRAVEVVDDVTLEHELQGRIGEKFVAVAVDERRAGGDFLLRIALEDILAVKSAVGEIAQFREKAFDAPLALALVQAVIHVRHDKTRRDKLPLRRFLCGQLDGGAHQGGVLRVLIGAFAREGREFARKVHQVVLGLGEIGLDAL